MGCRSWPAEVWQYWANSEREHSPRPSDSRANSGPPSRETLAAGCTTSMANVSGFGEEDRGVGHRARHRYSL